MLGSSVVDKLVADGWKPQFTASGQRLVESLENYRTLGFETTTVPLSELNCGECTACFDDETEQSVMIFTRKAKSDTQDDELFD
jgi:hypothetical protein